MEYKRNGVRFDTTEMDSWTNEEKLAFYEWIFEKLPATVYVNNVEKNIPSGVARSLNELLVSAMKI